jgi:hypothetical protein
MNLSEVTILSVVLLSDEKKFSFLRYFFTLIATNIQCKARASLQMSIRISTT